MALNTLNGARDALTRDFDLHQRKDLEYENGNPAERIGDDNGEEAFGNGQLFLNVVLYLVVCVPVLWIL